MASPSSAMGLRRLRILRGLAGARAPLTVSLLARQVGLTPRTVRDHLHWLLELGCVARFNFRRWQLADGFTLKGFDLLKLDGDPDANS